jgi:hypothetical protein
MYIKVIFNITAAFMLCAAVHGKNYYVGKNGNDNNSGLSKKQAFNSIKRAVKVMTPGDSLNILPGVYHESVEWYFTGGDRKTVIKADIPGTVILRGDIDAPGFTPVPNSKRIWQCKLKEIPQAVNERDTLTIYSRMPSVAEMDFSPGSWFYDDSRKILYVHTSDSEAPNKHYLTISNIRGHGIMICGQKKVSNVIIDGITVTGFNANSPGGRPGHNAKWGIYLTAPQNCTVRRVNAFLNGSGIGFTYPSSNSTIEECRAYANHSPYYGSGGNIIVLTPAKNDAIRKCVSFASKTAGIRYYGGKPAENSVFEDNISFENSYGDLWVKYPSDSTVARRCVAGKALHSRRAENCIFDYGVQYYFGAAQNCIIRPNEKKYNPDREFADPVNHDYHLQSDSVFRNSGKNGVDRGVAPFSKLVYFVKNSGNNSKDGNSMRSAWKDLSFAAAKLTDGATLYLAPGIYKGAILLKNLKNISIKGRGSIPAIMNGNIKLVNCKNVTIERINFLSKSTAVEVVDCTDLKLSQLSASSAIRLTNCENAEITHNIFLSKINLDSCRKCVFQNNILGRNSEISVDNSKIYSDFNSYTDKVPKAEKNSICALPDFTDASKGIFTLKNSFLFNGRGSDAMPIGTFRKHSRAENLKLDGPYLLSVSPTTANIEFWSNMPASGELRFGKTQRCTRRVAFNKPSTFQTISLTGLKPGDKYYFKVRAYAKAGSEYSNQELVPKLQTDVRRYQSKTIAFTLPAKAAPGRTLHVAVDGSNSNSGIDRKNALRTISFAAAKANAGDIIMVHEGRYFETIRVRSTGDKGRILTIRSAPGEKVWIDGNNRQLEQGFLIFNKDYIKIDGFYFYDFHQRSSAMTGGVILYNSNNIELSRLFYDGRSKGYSPFFVNAEKCRNLNINNCLLTRCFSGMNFSRCPGLVMRNSVIYINQVTSCCIQNTPDQKASFFNNIWVDNTLQKVGNALIVLSDGASLIERNNCYLLRVPESEKTVFGYSYYNNKKLPFVCKNKVLDRQWRLQGRFATEMATYSKYLKRSKQKASALFVDPQMKALKYFIRFSNLADWEKNYRKLGSKHYFHEYHLQGKYQPLDFDDFFANNPECVKRGIGLQPEVFKDFKF